jgi:hypothetical protein
MPIGLSTLHGQPATNNPTTTAAIFITFLIAYPATAPNRKPHLPAEKRKSSTGKSEAVYPREVHNDLCFYQIDTQPADGNIRVIPPEKPKQVVHLHIFSSLLSSS